MTLLKFTLNNSDLMFLLILKKKFLTKVLRNKSTMLLNLLLLTGQNTKPAHLEDFMNNSKPFIPTSRMKFTMIFTALDTSPTNKLMVSSKELNTKSTILKRKSKRSSTILKKKLNIFSTNNIMSNNRFHPSQWLKFKP